MSTTLGRFIWGFEVFDSGPYQNNKLPFSYRLDLPAGSTTTYDDTSNPARGTRNWRLHRR